MPKISGAKAFIEGVRAMDESVSGIKLCEINIDRAEKTAVYRFICEKTVPDEVKDKIGDYCLAATPPSFLSAQAVISKVVADADLVRRAIFRFITTAYPSLAYDFALSDIEAEGENGFFRYKLHMIPSSCAYVRSNGALKAIDAYLERNFCDSFAGEAEEKEQKEHIELPSDTVDAAQLSTLEKRVIRVSDVVAVDDPSRPELAVYIEDATEPGEVTLCGVVSAVREKTAKNGRLFYIIDFEDGTGKASGVYFTRKSTAEKIAKMEAGQGIIARCRFEYYKERLSLTIDKIDFCTFPADFKPQAKRGKGVEPEYRVVKPQPAEEVRETTLFDKPDVLPPDLVRNVFVVFDLETTGTEASHDEITEIGAVKIVNGRIAETFQTLVKPSQHISDKITEITGIDDEMVKDAPAFKDVAGDFFKFSFGAVLVAHNADFDVKFMRTQAKPLDYYFRNRVIDTVQLAREVLPSLSNHKLNTVAEHYNVKFLHHRALSDAYATAQVFIEMAKTKKNLF